MIPTTIAGDGDCGGKAHGLIGISIVVDHRQQRMVNYSSITCKFGVVVSADGCKMSNGVGAGIYSNNLNISDSSWLADKSSVL